MKEIDHILAAQAMVRGKSYLECETEEERRAFDLARGILFYGNN